MASNDRPIVFVDIDGVLNTGKEYQRWNRRHDEAYQEKREKGIDDSDTRWTDLTGDAFAYLLFGDEHVAVLNEIVSRAGADIVVSSSWRMHYAGNFHKLEQIFRQVGVKGPILGPTPTTVGRRYTAVWAWINHHRLGQTVRFVCLDDEDPEYRDQEIAKHVCLIDPSKGLQPDDVERALRRLKIGWRRL